MVGGGRPSLPTATHRACRLLHECTLWPGSAWASPCLPKHTNPCSLLRAVTVGQASCTSSTLHSPVHQPANLLWRQRLYLQPVLPGLRVQPFLQRGQLPAHAGVHAGAGYRLPRHLQQFARRHLRHSEWQGWRRGRQGRRVSQAARPWWQSRKVRCEASNSKRKVLNRGMLFRVQPCMQAHT